MALAQKGDQRAYESLLLELDRVIESYAQRSIRRFSPNSDIEFAGDIVQEILLAIHDKRHTYDPAQKFLPWVFGIAFHKITDWKRKHHLEQKRLDYDFNMELIGEGVLSSFDGFDLSEILKKLLPLLNENQRLVIQLTKLDELTVSEAAAWLGLSESNVKVLTNRALQKLKLLLEEEVYEFAKS